MIFPLIAGLALTTAPASQPVPCAKQEGCARLSAAQLFALADQLYANGDKAGAAAILHSLTQDKHPELRAEARFRLAAVLEEMGDLEGAVQALRDLLAEQPNANRARLELARILGRMGKQGEAQGELARAEKFGLPPEVEQNVRRFSATLHAPHRHGLTVELTAGPDSNINRSTSSQFIDTIIAPFELDADARQQSGSGVTGSARAYSLDNVGGVQVLSGANIRADLYNRARFDDIQLSLDSGPQFSVAKTTIRPAALYERRWFGQHAFSSGIGGDVDATVPLTSRAQLALSANTVRQTIDLNRDQDGWRTAAGADLLQQFSGGSLLARFSLRYGRLDASARPESLRQFGGGFLLAHQSRAVTIFGELDYTRTHGIEAQFLIGKVRHDHRWDLTGAIILNEAKLAGFAPIMRLTHTDSSANIVLFDYHRTRVDFGVTRTL
ncbi:MAG TPA: surface lipoprotein assembly modifier [Sphingomicrobium sp.]|nr:surface lipoprotein assembly modifier [Sphingomicrobium sp.]